MKLAEDDLRAAFHEVADATPIPDRWDAIVDGSARVRRIRAIGYSTGGLAIAAAIVAVVALALSLGSTTPKFTVTAGAPRTDGVSVFPNGPSVALGRMSHGRLAFVSDSNLYVADAGAHTVRQLTHSGDASALSWSADGEWLAFSVRDAPGYEDYTTWIARADGSDARRLRGMSDTFAWSPTGHRLAIAGFCCTDSQRGGVFVVDAGGQVRPIVAPGSQIPTLAWSPDGRSIGYTAASIDGPAAPSVWTIAVDGGRPQHVIDGQIVMWAPDGRSLLVDGPHYVELVGLDGLDRRVLAGSADEGGTYPSTWAAFSPSRDMVAVVGNDAGGLFVCHTDGASCLSVAYAKNPPISGVSFSPDGRAVTYVTDGALWIVSVSSSDPFDGIILPRKIDDLGRDLLQGAGDGVHITRGTAPNVPVWLSDGTILYHHGPQLRVIDPDGGASHTIADPLGFSDAGAKDQGLPGGQPVAVWQLTTH